MKILVLSNLYPPHFIGGYELGCRDVVEELKGRGHEVTVLTSFYGLDRPTTDSGVLRWLYFDVPYRGRNPLSSLAYLLKKERRNPQALAKAIRETAPDVIYIFNLGRVSASLALTVDEFGIPAFFFVSDHWFKQWRENDVWFHAWGLLTRRVGPVYNGLRAIARAFKLLPAKEEIPFRHVHFTSRFLQRELLGDKEIDLAHIVHWGVDSKPYIYREDRRPGRKLLYVGQLVPAKGVHTAIEALRILLQEQGFTDATLTLVGGSVLPEYAGQLRKQAEDAGIVDHLNWVGFVPREKVKDIYAEHDILIFPSIWDEPFSITVLKAMGPGCPSWGP